MKRILVTLPLVITLALPFVASAHEHATYQIGKNYYQVVIGSLNEPVAVDDKTGIDLTITKCLTSACAPTKGPDGDMDGPVGPPVTGLDSTLKAELNAGAQKKSVSLAPVYGKAGSYAAAFYPTVATTFSYHFTGTIHETPVDLTYTCLPEGTPRAPMNTTLVKLSDVVTQTSIGGGFGCPGQKEPLGFPEQSASVVSIGSAVSRAGTKGTIGIVLGALAFALSGAALVKRR